MKRTYTAEQEQIIEHDTGNALVRASAGSGKSTTLEARVVRLVQSGWRPNRVLMCVFNRDNADDFERRMMTHFSSDGLPLVRTYHALAKGMTDRLTRLGAMPKWRLITNDRELNGLSIQALKATSTTSLRKRPAELVEDFCSYVDLRKSDVDGNPQTAARFSPEAVSVFAEAFKAFEHLRQLEGVRFFNDLLYDLILTLRSDPALWVHFAGKLDHALLDEFQDINGITFELIKGLTREGTHTMACGDPAQSIYAFRGAQVEFITERFAQSYAPVTHYSLQYTFRFGHELAYAASALIGHNKAGGECLTVAHPSCPTTPIELHTYAPDKATGIAGLLSHAHQRHELHHACILVRSFSAAIPLEMELLRAGIPFYVDGREPLTRVPEITAQIALLRAVVDLPLAETEVQSLLRYPTLYLPGPIQSKLTQYAAQRSGPMRLHTALLEFLQREPGLDTRQSEAIRKRADVLATLATEFGITANPRTVLQRYAQLTQLDQTIAKASASVTKANELSATKAAFEQYAGRHPSVETLLQEWEMTAGESDRAPQVDHIRITSIHRSKGDEYPWTIVAGLDHAIIPGADPIDLEEERRLMYVAMTRAKHRLTLLAPISTDWERAVAFDQLLKRGHRLLLESHQTSAAQSRFIDEADLGAARSVASVLAGAQGEVKAGNPALVTRYFGAIGAPAPTIAKTTPSNVAKGSGRPSFTAPQDTPQYGLFDDLRAGDVVQVGDRLMSRNRREQGTVIEVMPSGTLKLQKPNGGTFAVKPLPGQWLHAKRLTSTVSV